MRVDPQSDTETRFMQDPTGGVRAASNANAAPRGEFFPAASRVRISIDPKAGGNQSREPRHPDTITVQFAHTADALILRDGNEDAIMATLAENG